MKDDVWSEKNRFKITPTTRRDQTQTVKRLNANSLVGCKKTKCKNCKLDCPFKKFNLKEDKNCLCTIPESRNYSLVYGLPIITEGILDKMSYENIMLMKETSQNVGDLKRTQDSLMDYWDRLFPKVKQNLNVNVDKKDTAENIIDVIFDEVYDETEKKKKGKV